MYFYPLSFYSSMIILIPGIILAMYAQAKVKSTFARYSKVASSKGLTGADVARAILRSQGLDHVGVEMIGGNLSDHYDPRVKMVRLSQQVYQGNSLASLGVAAHETGHAVQHAVGYVPLNIRNGLVPVANFGSNLAFPLLFIGLFLSGSMGTNLVYLGIYLFAAVVLFQLVTLPVEFNASSRAMAILHNGDYISSDELPKTKSVLDAAAMTYVASALMGILNLVRLLLISGVLGGRRRS